MNTPIETTVVVAIRTALILPYDSTDDEVLAEVKKLVTDLAAFKRRVVEEGTDLYQELSQARKDIAALAAELRALKKG